ncbi:BrnT family toxin [Laspinema olomoucense]|uniref:BrnT family toxin n=1 Tax=Laspinema olomoucense D3b TaxID=2953688 RepID=A0ABT2N8Y9_9CYAN|nr:MULTISPECIES: BrnT family toxin [unclassified Laspinema]MCT7978916.1 BrnT family toxin [Laspinema sp. D3b]MCT7988468.1 BrnT family toxin [Laspinema sp. D3a]
MRAIAYSPSVIFAAGVETSAFDSVNMNFWQNLITICSNSQGMEFEWDETKRLTNLRKHGIDFIDVSIIFDGNIVTFEDDRFNYGEQRFVTFGLLQGRVVAVVHTEREECIRIISARKATKYEQQIYFEQLSN